MAYVEAEKLKRNIRVNLMPNVDVDGTVTVENAERFFLDLIDKTSTADVEEVKHAYWEEHVEKGNCFEHAYYICTNCGVGALDEGYEIRCHHCGAKMDGTPKERGTE